MYSLPGSYDYLMTSFTYDKDTISLHVITHTLLSHSKRRQSVEKESQHDASEKFKLMHKKNKKLQIYYIKFHLI